MTPLPRPRPIRAAVAVAALALLPALIGAQRLTGQPLRWEATGTVAGTLLGHSVTKLGDIDGDGFPDVLAGGYYLGQGAPPPLRIHSGRDGHVLRTHPHLHPSFGRSGAGLGDVDGDGRADYAIGAPQDGAAGGGVVYVHSGATGALVHVITWPEAGARFGDSIASAGDCNGDGREDFCVGITSWDSPTLQDCGRAVIFSGLDGSVLRTADGAAAHDQFGGRIARIGDADGDGRPEVAVATRKGGGTGSVRILLSGGGTRLIVSPYTGTFYGSFGAGLADAGDLDGDGAGDVVVATGSYSTPCSIRGYSGAHGGLLRSFMTPQLGFGDLDSVGDLDGDGIFDALVGQVTAIGTPGRVLILSLDDGSTLFELTDPESTFGDSVACIGRPEKGPTAIVVGTSSFDQPSTNAGRVQLFEVAARPGSVAVTAHSSSAVADLVLMSGVNQNPLTSGDTKKLDIGKPLALRIASPNGNYDGLPVFLFESFGPMPAGTPGLPELWVDVLTPYTWVQLLGDPVIANMLGGFYLPLFGNHLTLPPGGLDLVVPPSLTLPPISPIGLAANFQAVVLDPSHPRGLVTTAAHQVTFVDEAIYVSAQAGPNGTGSRTAPLKDLSDAYAAAAAANASTIIVATGTYHESSAAAPLTFDRAISVLGGYDPSSWTRAPGAYSTLVVSHLGLRIRDITSKTTTISGLDVQAGSAPPGSTGTAAYGLDVRNCTLALHLDDCVVTAGDGAPGGAGLSATTSGTSGASGTNGTLGFVVPVNHQPQNAGSGGGGSQPGGNGGRGGGFSWSCAVPPPIGPCVWYGPSGYGTTAGASGAGSGSNGGNGGTFVTCSPVPQDGADGGVGFPGSHGAQGAAAGDGRGTVGALGSWAPYLGSSGAAGGAGGGGGGGGGGAAAMCPLAVSAAVLGVSGGGGGGGGAGGLGGQPGNGGQQGGGSFALYLVDASPLVTVCRLQAGNGGTGGNGGNGTAGGQGGQGGTGGSSISLTLALSAIGVGIDSGAGGKGGSGGDGGAGGGGSGGNGGPSAAVVRVGGSNPPGLLTGSSGNQLIPGSAGSPGQGGSNGAGFPAQSGYPGTAAAIISLP